MTAARPPRRAFSGVLWRAARTVTVDTTPLRHRNFRRLWMGQAISVFGSQMTLVAVPFQVFAITDDSFYVGLTSIVALIPLIIFGLYGGAIADAVDRRILLLLTACGLGLTSLVLWGQALASGDGNLVLLWTLTAAQSALFAMNSPARSAAIPRLLPPEQVPSANALNQLVFSSGVIIGPLVAGLIIASVGLPWTYFLDAVSFLAALTLLVRLPPLPPERDENSGRATVGEGLRFLGARKVLLMTFLVDINAMVFGWPRALFPELAEDRFGGGAALGWLYAASAIGALFIALFSGWFGRVNRQGLAIVVSIVLWGVAIGLFGVTGSLPLAVLFLALAGAADMVSAVFRSSILQLAAPDDMRGRLQGVFIVVVAGGPRLGDMRAGGVAAVSTPTFSLVSGGVLSVVGVVALAAAVPSFVRYDARRREGSPTT